MITCSLDTVCSQLNHEQFLNRLISVIFPIYNEVECINETYKTVKAALDFAELTYELILVNDGSIDGTAKKIDDIAASDSKVKAIHFAKNYGQTAAMMAGIDYARGEVIVAMDADGQNDPHDIPRLLKVIDQGYDVVSGWRKDRKDKCLSRKIPSKIANWLISKVSGVKLKDYGCSLKAYRSSIIKHVSLYGEMHRFIPIYAYWYGARVVETPVNHHPRTSGSSKYGLNRTFKVILDLMVVKFLQSYVTKPIYLIGGFGLSCFLIGAISLSFAVCLKVFYAVSFVQTPLLLLTVMMIIMGIMSIFMGIGYEMLTRIYFESKNKRPYHIMRTRNLGKDSGG